MSEQAQPFRGPGSGDGVSDADEEAAARTANRFDIRRIIGGLFVLYGVVLVVTGIVGSSVVKNKADGVNLDLWTGLAMLVFGVGMFAWGVLRPVQPDPPERRGRGSGRLRRAPS
jgi:hypothetical protein